MSDIISKLRQIKEASYQLASTSEKMINMVLETLALILQEDTREILAANDQDLVLMEKHNPKYDRLLLTEARIQSMVSEVLKVRDLQFPVGIVRESRVLPNGLSLKKVSVPFGVVGVIYESRPNVTIDVFVLCLKSGNACILKGGKEALHTNRMLFNCIQKALQHHGMSADFAFLMPDDREALHELLQASEYVDLCIPRGGKSLIDFVKHNSKIPVIETGAGIVHIYFDESGDVNMGSNIILNAKTRRVSVCNALDTLIIHEKCLKFLPGLVSKLALHNVEIHADKESFKALKGLYPETLLCQAVEEDFGTEFLSYKMSIKTVSSIDKAIEHIRQYSSLHSEAIIASSESSINKFISNVDAAVCYINASTSFTDGGEFGMGAEIGISTQKLHARGPMSLNELNSYKWVVYGSGQVRE